ncbi:MAG: hypothetical protein AAB886_02525 [Patescibacteria group bacterium]
MHLLTVVCEHEANFVGDNGAKNKKTLVKIALESQPHWGGQPQSSERFFVCALQLVV